MHNAEEKVKDASDAGMLFYAITGNKTGEAEDAKDYFNANPPEFISNSESPYTVNDLYLVPPIDDPLTGAGAEVIQSNDDFNEDLDFSLGLESSEVSELPFTSDFKSFDLAISESSDTD